MISKTLSTSVCYARLFDVAPEMAEFSQSLYPLLVAHSDDFGREQGDVVTVKYRIHPRSPRSEAEFTRAMTALRDVGLIEWYESRGRQCYQIVKFDEHQTGLHKRTRSHFPAATSGSGIFPEASSSGKFQETSGQENLTEENLTEQEKDQNRQAKPSNGFASPALLNYPTVGSPNTWTLTAGNVTEWTALYPNLDVLTECRKALAWLKANPTKRKTAKGMPRFLVNWFSRTADRGGTPQDVPVKPLKGDDGAWFTECKTLHDSACGGRTAHANRLFIDAEKVKSGS